MPPSRLLEYATALRAAVIADSSSAMLCMAITAPLHSALQRLGVKTLITASELDTCNHLFLTLDDGQVLDPTADQFNTPGSPRYPPVYLGPMLDIHRPSKPWPHPSYWCRLLESGAHLVSADDPRAVGRFVRIVLDTLPDQLQPRRRAHH